MALGKRTARRLGAEAPLKSKGGNAQEGHGDAAEWAAKVVLSSRGWEREARIELATIGLEDRSSTAELLPQFGR